MADYDMETTLCRECGTDTSINGFVNRVSGDIDIETESGTFLSLDLYVCGVCISTWEARDYYEKDNEGNLILVWCDAENDSFHKGNRHNIYNYHPAEIDETKWERQDYWDTAPCDEEETATMKWWIPEVDSMFPDAKKFRVLINGGENGRLDAMDMRDLLALIKNYRYVENKQ